MIIGMDERGETMAEDNRWAGFSDEELQLIADRLGDALLSVELRQERKDRARIVEEINAEFRRREDEQSTYRGPGRYVGYGRRLEVFGTFGHDVLDQATAPATVKIDGVGPDWIRLETEDGRYYTLGVGDTFTVPAPVVS
jgi:hypothetical protein